MNDVKLPTGAIKLESDYEWTLSSSLISIDVKSAEMWTNSKTGNEIIQRKRDVIKILSDDLTFFARVGIKRSSALVLHRIINKGEVTMILQ
jgi:hypothetical protein